MADPACPCCARTALLVGGDTIYPSRPDLAGKNFWQCARCDAHVGCHDAGCGPGRRDGTVPLGTLANPQLRRARQMAHAAFDPLWRGKQNKAAARRAAYQWLAGCLGISALNCHISMMNLDACAAVVNHCMHRRPA